MQIVLSESYALKVVSQVCITFYLPTTELAVRSLGSGMWQVMRFVLVNIKMT